MIATARTSSRARSVATICASSRAMALLKRRERAGRIEHAIGVFPQLGRMPQRKLTGHAPLPQTSNALVSVSPLQT